MFDIALLTDSRYADPVNPLRYVQNILDDDALLSTALQTRHDLRTIRVDWADPKFDWGQVRAAVFRTTWDYYDRFEEFQAWMARAEKVTTFLNPAPLIRWNLDKHYLLDLESRGIAIPKTAMLEKNDRFAFSDAVRRMGSREIIIKPAVSGAAKNTFRVNETNASEIEQKVNALLSSEAFLIQPFLESVLAQGEMSLMVFGDTFTHAVRKIPKAGDFRVQDDHGGTVVEYEPTREEITFAEKATQCCSPASLYSRVDIVRDNSGNLSLMELEVIEPELFMRYHPKSAEAFASQIATSLSK